MEYMEYMEYMRNMLLEIKNTWPNAKIILMNFPLYQVNLERSEENFAPWKSEFYEIINYLKTVVEFDYIDYTNHAISRERVLWYDHGHLNYWGAVQFTQEINKLL